MTTALLGTLVAFCCRRAAAVVFLAACLTGFSAWYTATHFVMNTDAAALIREDIPWRQHELAYARAFPQFDKLILVVVDGRTPEIAEQATAGLAERLGARRDLFTQVERPDGGEFFQREGLLFSGVDEVKATTRQLIAAQGFLGTLAADPSLRGVMEALSAAMQGVSLGEAGLDQIAGPLRGLADAFEAVADGRPAFLSWRSLLTGAQPTLRETRRFILVKPVLDYHALMPGEKPVAAVRQAAADLDLSPQTGVQVRLTGPVPIADEEFATIADRAGLMVGAMVGAVLLMLWLAVRSFRLILAIVASLLCGLVVTTAFGLAVFGSFNLISVAFIALFVGLAVDFGIQFAVRFRDERRHASGLDAGLAAAGAGAGHALALAAAATALGFFAFLPTDYIGIGQLGATAGVGMIIAFILSLTLLPALIHLLRPAGKGAEAGLPALAPVEDWLVRRRRPVLAVAALLGLVGAALLPFLDFDFDPMNLRSRQVESVATLYDLMRDPDTSPNAINVIVPADRAAAMAAQLSALPQVSRVLSLASYIPQDQEAKLALIRDARDLLADTLDPFDAKPPPTDAQVAEAMGKTAAALRAAAAGDADARQLAAALDRLAKGDEALRARAARTVMPGLVLLLRQLKLALSAKAVTPADLPAQLARDWTAPDGQARLQAYPKDLAADPVALRSFADAVEAVAPDATGVPISIHGAGETIIHAFAQAGGWSCLAVLVLLGLVLRRAGDVLRAFLPLVLTLLLTLGTCVLIGEPINFANIIALPLLFGIGVAFNIYFVMAWRGGARNLLRSSLARAVLFSALTTASAFGALWLSIHPGTASMGKLLMISLGWTLFSALIVQPVLLAPAGKAPP